MKKQKKIVHTDEPQDEGWEYDLANVLTREEELAYGIPSPEEAAKMKLVRRPARPTRINIRLGQSTLDGLRSRAEELGMPYQTLAASVLHQVATGRITLKWCRVERRIQNFEC